MNRDEKIDYERWYLDVQGLIQRVHYSFSLYSGAYDAVNRAYHLIELSEAIGDLASWHSSYDINDGLLDWQREDADD